MSDDGAGLAGTDKTAGWPGFDGGVSRPFLRPDNGSGPTVTEAEKAYWRREAAKDSADAYRAEWAAKGFPDVRVPSRWQAATPYVDPPVDPPIELVFPELRQPKLPARGVDPIYFAEAVEQVFDQLEEVLLSKHRDYGPSNIANAPGGPLYGLQVRIHDKVARINHLLDKGVGPENESLEDSFLDLANYAAIAVLVLRKQWPS